MTTIVFLAHEVAGDGLITIDGHVLNTKYQKIHETNDVIIGGAGSVTQLQRLIDWILQGYDPDAAPPLPDDEPPMYELAFIDKHTNKVYRVEGRFPEAIEVEYPVCLGSGASLAHGSILQQMKDREDKLEVSAREAINIAKKVDTGTGGKIKVIKVVQPKHSLDEE